ncbi:YrbE family protein [Gordonia effusa NBRC 100432]|uniref:YrbE family protein n=1 Tax=Gordonia effusa NBRC 100432 TaxID=1077974 RepID=H0R5M9_9ACTN|nr:ABC transporter permease [Gordonia effusa]GAB20380.1 YrbE family protein [Gordonia effusa NBRC 100432]
MATAALTRSPSTTAVLRDNLRDNALGPVETLGRTFRLGATSVAMLIVDTFRWRVKMREAVLQAWYMISVTAIPAFLMAIPFGVIVTVQIGNIINQLGAQSLLGAGSGFAVIQQAAPLASGMLLGGAGASAIAADLGARSVREEIDALRVMGIDPVQRLVVPRIIAAVVVAPLLALFIVLVGVISAFYLSVTLQGVGPGSYWQSFGAFASIRDLAMAMIKAIIFGFMIAVIGCQRGLEARGGPRGVADGVNATVVISTVAIIVVNMVLTLVYTIYFPLQLG